MKEYIKIKNGKLLREEKDHYVVVFEGDDGESIIPKNKFRHNEIVRSSDKHYSQHPITRLQEPTFTTTRGWIYIENHISYNSMSGSCGFWNDEFDYEPITDPTDILFRERLYAQEAIQQYEQALKNQRDKLAKIEYALDLALPEFRDVKSRCRKCGRYYTQQTCGNPNRDLCIDCVKAEEQAKRSKELEKNLKLLKNVWRS